MNIDEFNEVTLKKIKKAELVDIMDAHDIPLPANLDKTNKGKLIEMILEYKESLEAETTITNPDDVVNDAQEPEPEPQPVEKPEKTSGIEYVYTVKKNDIREFEAHEIKMIDGKEAERTLIKKDVLAIVKAKLWRQIYERTAK